MHRSRHAQRAIRHGIDRAREVVAREKLHDDEGHAIRQAIDVEDLHHVFVGDARGRNRLVVESLDGPRNRDDVRVDELQRHGHTAKQMLGLQDGAHTALAKNPVDGVLLEKHLARLRERVHEVGGIHGARTLPAIGGRAQFRVAKSRFVLRGLRCDRSTSPTPERSCKGANHGVRLASSLHPCLAPR